MIQVVFGDSSRLMNPEAFSYHLNSLCESAKNRVLEAKRMEHRANRLMYFLIADALYKRQKGEPLPQVLFSDRGKPYLEVGPAISVSHDKMLVAVAMSEAHKELGVDIQSQPNPVMASRVRRRFLTPAPAYRKGEPEIEFMMAHVEKDGIDLTPTHPYGTPSSFLGDYVLAEAVMKMSGGGFADFPNLGALCATCETAILPLDEVAIGIAYR